MRIDSKAARFRPVDSNPNIIHGLDEVGTPFGITADGQTLQDQTVTVRERDSLVQMRVAAYERMG